MAPQLVITWHPKHFRETVNRRTQPEFQMFEGLTDVASQDQPIVWPGAPTFSSSRLAR